jgi:DnaK suppressor protein
MAKPKKKKKFAKKSAARRARSARKVSKPARKLHAKRPVSKRATAAAKRSAKSSKSKREAATRSPVTLLGLNNREKKLNPFIRKQKEKLLQLREADAGSDAYDRDFALSLLSQEQDALYEIDEALKRIELGTYGICEMSGKPIPHARLEAIPFARFTVECQSQLEKQSKASRVRQSVTSLFGLTEEEGGEAEEEEAAAPAEVKE